LNSLVLEGRLATAVKLNSYPSADGGEPKHKAEFLMAVSKRKRDAEPDWLWVTCWSRLAEVVAEHLVKGSRVTVRGRVTGRFLDKDRTKKGRLRMEIVAEEVTFGQRPKAAEDVPKGGRRS